MTLKKEIPLEGKLDQQRDRALRVSRDADDEFEELDAGVQDAVTTDSNEFPDMGEIDDVSDPNALIQDEELFEDDAIDLKNPEVAAELSEDPVRLYLRNIGQF